MSAWKLSILLLWRGAIAKCVLVTQQKVHLKKSINTRTHHTSNTNRLEWTPDCIVLPSLHLCEGWDFAGHRPACPQEQCSQCRCWSHLWQVIHKYMSAQTVSLWQTCCINVFPSKIWWLTRLGRTCPKKKQKNNWIFRAHFRCQLDLLIHVNPHRPWKLEEERKKEDLPLFVHVDFFGPDGLFLYSNQINYSGLAGIVTGVKV